MKNGACLNLKKFFKENKTKMFQKLKFKKYSKKQLYLKDR